IEVGGTNTDAVILNEQLEVGHGVKMPSSEDIQTGIEQALHRWIAEARIDPKKISHAMLGTTQGTNAIVERSNLAKVGVLRLGYPATASVAPYTAWPEDIVEVLSNHSALAQGGYEYDGQPLSELSKEEICTILTNWQGKIDSLAIAGVFSSLKNDQELQVAQWAKEVLGAELPVSLSSTIGSVGLIERENATILN